jgi:hypothetical protein
MFRFNSHSDPTASDRYSTFPQRSYAKYDYNDNSVLSSYTVALPNRRLPGPCNGRTGLMVLSAPNFSHNSKETQAARVSMNSH